jgi:hypothetical protein
MYITAVDRLKTVETIATGTVATIIVNADCSTQTRQMKQSSCSTIFQQHLCPSNVARSVHWTRESASRCLLSAPGASEDTSHTLMEQSLPADTKRPETYTAISKGTQHDGYLLQ